MNARQGPPLVAIVMGSESDRPSMEAASKELDGLGIPYEIEVISAHRTPERLRAWAGGAAERGLRAIIAGAGGAAALPGAVASWTTVPVLGVPLPTSELKGVDALYAIVQMPAGVPVATFGIGTAGARNAAYFAAAMIGQLDPEVGRAYAEFRRRQAEGIRA
jgi:5-(carboxyamino)imidazole ribonucleotide mutase